MDDFDKILYEYILRRIADELSPLHLIYGVVPKLPSSDGPHLLGDSDEHEYGALENTEIMSALTGPGTSHIQSSVPDIHFSTGALVLVAGRRSLGAIKMPA